MKQMKKHETKRPWNTAKLSSTRLPRLGPTNALNPDCWILHHWTAQISFGKMAKITRYR